MIPAAFAYHRAIEQAEAFFWWYCDDYVELVKGRAYGEGARADSARHALATSLSALSRRFQGLPLAGILLFTDGNRTDSGDIDWSRLPPAPI